MMADTGPPSRRAAFATVIAVSVGFAFIVLLFGGFIPGLKPNFTPSATTTVDGQPYYWTDYLIPGPDPPANTTTPSNVTFHNVSFSIWVTNWFSLTGGHVHGNGTEANGTAFSFVLEGFPVATTLYLTPDGSAGASWSGQSFVELLVRAPTSG